MFQKIQKKDLKAILGIFGHHTKSATPAGHAACTALMPESGDLSTAAQSLVRDLEGFISFICVGNFRKPVSLNDLRAVF